MTDNRYTITLEFCGYPSAKYVARFCGDWLGWSDTKAGAQALIDEVKVSVNDLAVVAAATLSREALIDAAREGQALDQCDED